MKKGTPMLNHLNELNSIYSPLIAHKVDFLESMKVFFLLITLPNTWETFKTTINTSQAAGGLSKATVTSNLLTEQCSYSEVDTKGKRKYKIQGPRVRPVVV